MKILTHNYFNRHGEAISLNLVIVWRFFNGKFWEFHFKYMVNQNAEQIARDNIDKQLVAFGWVILRKSFRQKSKRRYEDFER